MPLPKSVTSLVVAGSAALLLAGCASSYNIQALTITSKVSGKVDLNSFDPGITPFDRLPPGSPRTIPGNSTGIAQASLTASFSGGNWNVSGSWKDGDVQMRLKGYALELGEYVPWIGPYSGSAPGANGFDPSMAKSIGGMCLPVLTHYTSTNLARPGAGWAMLVVCDAPGTATSPEMGGFPQWQDPDYVKIYVPVVNSGDLNPFGNYLSGGYMDKGQTTNSIETSYLAPSYSPTPIWNAPCYTGSESNGPWTPCPVPDAAPAP